MRELASVIDVFQNSLHTNLYLESVKGVCSSAVCAGDLCLQANVCQYLSRHSKVPERAMPFCSILLV